RQRAEDDALIEERQQALRHAEQAQAERAIALKRLSKRTNYALMMLGILGAVVTVAAVVKYQQNRALQEANRQAIKKWYRIETDYELAIGTYKTQSSPATDAPLIGSGFLVKGDSLRPEWRDQVVFLTASHVIHGGNQNSEPDFAHASIMFPGIDGGTP